jgi:hypothetical protein
MQLKVLCSQNFLCCVADDVRVIMIQAKPNISGFLQS